MKFIVSFVFVIICLNFLGCATLLNLPDEQTEDFYRNNGKISKEQITKNMTASTGGKIMVADKPTVRILPILYSYTTYNTLKQGEEAYYTSRYTNHSWFRDFMMEAHHEIMLQLEKRGLQATSFDKDLSKLANGKDIEQVFKVGEARRGNPVRTAAFNIDENTNYGLPERNNVRSFIFDTDKAAILAALDVDWEPNTANTLNGDIVLNTTLTIGFNMTFCSVQACSEVNIPFAKGVKVNMPMPNKNTINKEGLVKNQTLINEIHGAHIRQLVDAAFEKLDAQGAFVK